MQPYHGAVKNFGADRNIQLALGNRNAQGDTPVEARDERADERAINRVQLQRVGSMNLFAGEPVEELPRVLVRVHGDARGGFGCLVQPGGVRRPNLDPCVDRTGQIADGQRGLARDRDSARECETVLEFEQVREHPRDEVILGF